MPWSIRPCPRPGCDEIVSGDQRYCDDHQAEYEQRRGSPTARGYGREHKATRVRLLPAAYGTACPLCGLIMTPSQALDLDHSVSLRRDKTSRGDRIVHASCNRRRRD